MGVRKDGRGLHAIVPRRSDWAPLAYPAFRRIAAAQALSRGGSWMQVVAAGWLAYDLTDSAVMVALVAVAVRGPGIVCSAHGGALADRFHPRHLALALYGFQVLPATVLTILASDGRIHMPEILVMLFLLGIASALVRPVLQRAVPCTVPPDLRLEANVIFRTGENVATFLGPLAGGVLIAAIGTTACFAVNAASFVVMAGVLALTGIERPRSLREQLGDRSLSIVAALRHATRGRTLLNLLIIALLVSLTAGPIRDLVPAISDEHGQSAAVVGVLFAALGLGSVLAALLVNTAQRLGLRRSRIVAIGGMVAAVAIAVLALSPLLPVDFAAMVALGGVWEMLSVQMLTWLADDAPDGMTGRMIGLSFAVSFAGLAAGALGFGALIDEIGAEGTLGVCAGGLAVIAVFLVLRPHTIDTASQVARAEQPAAGPAAAT
jgi:predicted MFS family arabinose efflux permease